MRVRVRTLAAVAVLVLGPLIAPPPAAAEGPPDPDLGQAVRDAVGFCFDAIGEAGKDAVSRLLEALTEEMVGYEGESPGEVIGIARDTATTFKVYYKIRNGEMTQNDIWDAGRLAVAIGGHLEDLLPDEFLASEPGAALKLTLEVATPWLYCMEAAAYVDQQAAIWVANRLRPIVNDLIRAHSIAIRPGLTGWLHSLGPSSPSSPSSPPAMPTGLTATAAGSREIDLRWADRSGDETAFVISNGDEERRVGAGVTAYRWAVAPGSYMCVKVKAVNGAGESGWYPDTSPWYVCTST